jgi:ATP-binding cassette subfamily B protein
VELMFEGAVRPALHGVDLSIEGGRTVAIVGPMGSGKTALVSLLPRLYDVTAGSVRVDGVDVRDADLVSLRSSIALVNDDPFLFSATVHENIAYARPEASRAEVEAAARAAQADGFIAALPDGYDTLVGERGLTLSGGQRQRLAIARAILADPRILILDDATSSVDASTEAQIKQALSTLMEGRTTLIVAHRLSTIALADEIVVLEGGTVTARGTHEELLRSSAVYREIVELGEAEREALEDVVADVRYEASGGRL